MRSISCCGTDCGQCSYHGNMCAGCNECAGKVFFMPEGNTCPIFDCTVNGKKFSNCGECKEVPCEIWKNTRDPQYSDEEFQKSINDRLAMLRELAVDGENAGYES